MDIQQARLILVDDDPGNLRLLSRILSGYRNQRLATSGAQALMLARAEAPDLVIADMQMPGLSGDQLCSLIRSDPMLGHIPVMIVTSDDTEAARIKLLKLGAADFVCKPLVPEQLQARVAALLRRTAQLSQVREGGPKSAPSYAAQSDAGPFKLLVVDDDAGALEVLHYALNGTGEVKAVASGKDALELAATWSPDIILLDASMPGMDGFEVCAALKAKPTSRHVPIVFVTKYSDSASETRALDMGAADFISKPYSPAVLKARVRNLLELKKRTDAELLAAAAHGHHLASERLGAIIEGASDAIVTVDSSGCIALMNAAAGRMFGVDHQAASGCMASTIVGLELPELAGREGVPPQLRLLLKRSGEAALPLELSASRVGSGALTLSTLMFRDLSDRERLETESRARADAEAASRAKTLMLSYIAHEMGNPLNCMLGFAQLLQLDAAAPLTPAQARRVEMIRAGGEQLSTLMRDLVDLGHFELGRIGVDVGELDAVAAVDDALMAVSALAEQGHVALRMAPCSDRPVLRADARRLQQCLVNLLSNGIKYNRSGGHVEVSVATDLRAAVVRIAVRDNGLGMDATQREHLFEPFNRLGRQSSSTPGTGLGLVVTRQLVEAMGGSLAVSSEVDEGSCFTISLPAGGRTP